MTNLPGSAVDGQPTQGIEIWICYSEREQKIPYRTGTVGSEGVLNNVFYRYIIQRN